MHRRTFTFAVQIDDSREDLHKEELGDRFFDRG